MNRSDEQLIAGVRRGDPTAFVEIHRRHSHELLRHAQRVLGSRGGAEDVTQEAFMRAYRALVATSKPIILRPWLHRIVHNAALDEYRRVSSRATLEHELRRAPQRLDGGQVVAIREEARSVLKNIAELPDRQRDVIVRHVIQGASHAQVADELDISVQASKALVYRARNTLQLAAA